MSTDHKPITDLLREYAQALRGDWGSIDGRSERDSLETMADWFDAPETFPGWERARDRIRVCPQGEGHWRMYCDEDCGDEQKGDD